MSALRRYSSLPRCMIADSDTEPSFISSSEENPAVRIPWHGKSSGIGFLYLKVPSNLEAALTEF
jgi:hypothetical protein